LTRLDNNPRHFGGGIIGGVTVSAYHISMVSAAGAFGT